MMTNYNSIKQRNQTMTIPATTFPAASISIANPAPTTKISIVIRIKLIYVSVIIQSTTEDNMKCPTCNNHDSNNIDNSNISDNRDSNSNSKDNNMFFFHSKC